MTEFGEAGPHNDDKIQFLETALIEAAREASSQQRRFEKTNGVDKVHCLIEQRRNACRDPNFDYTERQAL